MDNPSVQIEELRRQTQETRFQFLTTEVETCYIILDFGQTELQFRRRDVAEKEAREAEKAIATILRFLPELDDAAQRSVIQNHLEDLQRLLESFKSKLPSRTISG